MARVFIVTPSGGLFAVMYSVDQPVGVASPNRREDVLLVQFFLARNRDQDAAGRPGFIPPGRPPIVVDGVFGPTTAAHLTFFQTESNNRTAPRIRVDGRVDPLEGKLLGSHTASLLTMAVLNFEYLNRQGKGFHSNISIDPLFPAGLKSSLFMA
jgi:hypothetical protein